MSGRRCVSRPGSAVRSMVATAEVVGFSAVAHTAAGGSLPSPDLMVPLGALVGLVSFALRQRLLSLRIAAAVVVVGQVGLHTGFSAGGQHGVHTSPDGLTGLDGGMLLAHGLSAVCTVLALMWQEQLLVTAAHWLVATLPTDRPPLRWPRHAPCGEREVTATGHQVIACAPRRGPPAVAAAS